MEEARQHSSLSFEQWLFAAIYHLGSLALLASIALQIFLRIDALFPTLFAVATSRICLALWQIARPRGSKTERTPSGLVITMVVWVSTMLLLIWARLYGGT